VRFLRKLRRREALYVKLNSSSCSIKQQPLDQYIVGPYIITILSTTHGSVQLSLNVYKFVSIVENDPSLEGIFYLTTRHLKSSHLPFSSFSLDQILTQKIKLAKNFMEKLKINQPDEAINKIAELSAFKSMNLERIFPFLLDDNIEEFFLDSPNSSIYLDHRKWGRCLTKINLSEQELESFITLVRADSGYRLDMANPSIKTELITKYFHVRVSLDISPLVVNKLHLDVRKIRRKVLTLPELVANKTLSPMICAYIYFCLLRKRNIVITGEPGAGKTTLLNAIDILTPPDWRKITIEDVVESIQQLKYGKHQVRFKVEPYEEGEKRYSKSSEIIKLLHRSPDYIYLGEIQTEEHSRAMFHALSAGLTGLQTCHSAGPNHLLLRWIFHHKIPVALLQTLDLIIHVKKVRVHGNYVRRLIRVCELDADQKTKLDPALQEIHLIDVFKWNPATDTHEQCFNDLYNTPTMQKIREHEELSKERFLNELRFFHAVFEEMARRKIFDIEKVVKIFHYLHANYLRFNGKNIGLSTILDDVAI